MEKPLASYQNLTDTRQMSENTYFADQFLIAMPQMADPNFHKSVTYLCEHNAEGAMGITINRPMDMTVGEMLGQINIPVLDERLHNKQLLLGGPVQPERGFVLHSPASEWDSSLQISKDISLTSSGDILQAIGENQGPDKFLIVLGYAGWGAGQLEKEIIENTWLNGPADHKIIFDSKFNERWAQAAETIGIDLEKLSTLSGHA